MVLPPIIPDVVFSPNLTTRTVIVSTIGLSSTETGFFYDDLIYFPMPLINISTPSLANDPRLAIIAELFEIQNDTKVDMNTHGVYYNFTNNSIVINTTSLSYFRSFKVKIVTRFS